jgi:hypothetical protein
MRRDHVGGQKTHVVTDSSGRHGFYARTLKSWWRNLRDRPPRLPCVASQHKGVGSRTRWHWKCPAPAAVLGPASMGSAVLSSRRPVASESAASYRLRP